MQLFTHLLSSYLQGKVDFFSALLVAKHEIRIAKHETMTANLDILVSCLDFNFKMAASIITCL